MEFIIGGAAGLGGGLPGGGAGTLDTGGGGGFPFEEGPVGISLGAGGGGEAFGAGLAGADIDLPGGGGAAVLFGAGGLAGVGAEDLTTGAGPFRVGGAGIPIIPPPPPPLPFGASSIGPLRSFVSVCANFFPFLICSSRSARDAILRKKKGAH